MPSGALRDLFPKKEEVPSVPPTVQVLADAITSPPEEDPRNYVPSPLQDPIVEKKRRGRKKKVVDEGTAAPPAFPQRTSEGDTLTPMVGGGSAATTERRVTRKRRAKKQKVGKYEACGQELGRLVDEKNASYGDAFTCAPKFLELLWPNGVPVSAYADMLTQVRIFDKQKRIATDVNAFGESPYKDIAGYGLLGSQLPRP